MKLALQVRDPFHLDGVLLERGTVLTDEQAAFVRKDKNAELRRRCTQFALDENPPDAVAQEAPSPQAPDVETRRSKTARDKQE